jgi:hypothetical protein
MFSTNILYDKNSENAESLLDTKINKSACKHAS